MLPWFSVCVCVHVRACACVCVFIPCMHGELEERTSKKHFWGVCVRRGGLSEHPCVLHKRPKLKAPGEFKCQSSVIWPPPGHTHTHIHTHTHTHTFQFPSRVAHGWSVGVNGSSRYHLNVEEEEVVGVSVQRSRVNSRQVLLLTWHLTTAGRVYWSDGEEERPVVKQEEETKGQTLT